MNTKVNMVNFLINGKEHTVNTDGNLQLGPNSLLVDYIRDVAGLKGTKYMCREGGCGACVVTVKTKDPVSGEESVRAVNSCLTPTFSCNGFKISTVEHLGNSKDCYHDIQQKLSSFGGTQCGFCTPGMVMNMYSLVESKKEFTAKDVEDQFDGNICRCTGYRPILDAFKSFAKDAHEDIRRKCMDIEECNKVKCEKNLPKSQEKEDKCDSYGKNQPIHLRLNSGEQWMKPDNLSNLFEAIELFKTEGINYRLVAGNTSTGIFKNDGPYTSYIDVNGIPDLRKITIDKSGVILGGAVTLYEAIEALKKASTLEGYEYAAAVSKHLLRVANVPVRNIATIGGNLMIKRFHPSFPSDVVVLMGSIGAKINIATAPSLQDKMSVKDFLNTDMKGKILLSIHFPSLPVSAGYHFRSFKISKRYQNAHAYVNAGFLLKVDSANYNVLESNILFGGITSDFTHASDTEAYLVGKSLSDATVLQGALAKLENEIKPENKPPDATPVYRKSLTQSLLYKTILGILGTKVKENVKTGQDDIEHIQTYGKQTYDSDERDWPVNQPVVKLESAIQCSGEAEYVNDIQPQHGELAGAFVVTTVANAELKSVDPTEALKLPGVVKFIQAKDIPGDNNYMAFYGIPEEIFVKNKIIAAGQPIGLIIAEAREVALRAAKLVKVEYSNIQKPILTIPDSITAAEAEGKTEELLLPVMTTPKLIEGESKNKIQGEFRTPSQFHFQMENHVTICIPKEDGLDVYCATQWIDMVQAAISSALRIPNNAINISVRRLGGGYGSKISRSTNVAVACALAAQITNKPVRIVVDLETNFRMLGKRLPYLAKYEVGFDDTGKIENLDCKLFCDPGSVPNEVTSQLAALCMNNTYTATGWKITPGKAVTNTVSNTYCRSPGSTQGIAVIENIMEHISHHLKKDPLEVRQVNLLKDGDQLLGDPNVVFSDPSSEDYAEILKNAVDKFEGENFIPRMIDEIKVSGQYEERKTHIDAFNKQNRWKKRGMAIVPMRYPVHYFSTFFPAYVAIYHSDGTVVVSHGGIEMGQGINTKVAQVVAHTLKIPLDKVRVKATNNLVSPNAMTTGGAITSEIASFAAMEACKLLIKKMSPIKKKMRTASWEKLIAACYSVGIDLRAHYLPSSRDQFKFYSVWGLNLTEVEVDMLTGEYKIVRCDIIEDAGKSLSQEIDIGQVEGALVMGLGLWTTEKIQYDENTGEVITPNSWEYKVPLPKDIPEDLRITLLQNTPNPVGILRSKATGEPPLCMSVCVLFAIRQAIKAAREDAGNTDYFRIDGPVTPEDVLRLSLSTKENFTF